MDDILFGRQQRKYIEDRDKKSDDISAEELKSIVEALNNLSNIWDIKIYDSMSSSAGSGDVGLTIRDLEYFPYSQTSPTANSSLCVGFISWSREKHQFVMWNGSSWIPVNEETKQSIQEKDSM